MFALALWLLVKRRASRKPLLAVAGVLVLAILMVSWLGISQVLQRFSSLQTLETTERKRAAMRDGAWRIFLDHPLNGTGLGTLPIVFPAYETLYDGKIVNHAHNDYLETLADTGILGAACCLWFLVTLFLGPLRRLWRGGGAFGEALSLAGLLGCIGLLVHSLVDFN